MKKQFKTNAQIYKVKNQIQQPKRWLASYKIIAYNLRD